MSDSAAAIFGKAGAVFLDGLGPDARKLLASLASLPPATRDQLRARLQANVERHDAYHRFDNMYPDRGPLRRELYRKHLAFFAATAKYVEVGLLGGNRSGNLPAQPMH